MANDIVNIKDIKNLKKNIDYTNYIDINGGKIKNEQSSKNVFFTNNSEVFQIEGKYSGNIRDLSQKNKDFLKNWLLAKYNDVDRENKNIMLNLQEFEFDMFYKELIISYDGGTQKFIIQKSVANKLEFNNSLKNSILKFDIILLGFLNYNDDYYLITNYSTDASKIVVNKNDYIIAKNAIVDGRYDFATRKIHEYIKKYPNNFEAKKDLCLISYIKYKKLPSKILLNNTLKCLQSSELFYKSADTYYMLSILYKENTELEAKERLNKMLLNLNKAIQLLEGEKNLTLNEKIIFYNSLYLRGTLKISYNDKSGYNDLSIVEAERPDLINLNIYEGK